MAVVAAGRGDIGEAACVRRVRHAAEGIALKLEGGAA